jgi:uncharacterized Rossmann fold enzyme
MMDFETWEPVYEQILADMGFDRTADERARDRLEELCPENTGAVLSSLDYSGRTVAIAGGAETLTDETHLARSADVVVAASLAAKRLREVGIAVDCMVTDLDKTPETARALTEEGVPVAVHAHGDNVPVVEAHVPGFDHEYLIPTTQARPTGPVCNFGGFTDGDRAAFLADALGAETLVFPGWEFDDASVDAVKRRKLQWAERLLYWLEHRRDEQFGCLDGRRGDIDAVGFSL